MLRALVVLVTLLGAVAARPAPANTRRDEVRNVPSRHAHPVARDGGAPVSVGRVSKSLTFLDLLPSWRLAGWDALTASIVVSWAALACRPSPIAAAPVGESERDQRPFILRACGYTTRNDAGPLA